MLPNIHAQKYMRCVIGLGAATAISAGASLAAGGATLWANSNMNKKNQKWNEKMVKQARQWQEKMYNQYNSPQAQAQQLAAAGVNPYNQGGASTTPMSTSTSAPSFEQHPNDFGFIAEAGANVANTLLQQPALEAQNLSNRETEVRIEGMLTDNRIKLYDEMMRAIDAGNYEYATMLNNERIREDIRLSKATRKEKLQSRKNMEKEFDILVEDHKEKVRNNQLGDQAAAAGVNSAIDEHNLIAAQTKLAEAAAKLNDTQRQSVQFALDLSKNFDEKFMDLSFQERQQQVKEFLDNSDIRNSMLQFAHDIQKNERDISNRETTLNEVESRIRRDILTTIEKNKNSDSLSDNLESVLALSFMDNPSATLNAITSLVPF